MPRLAASITSDPSGRSPSTVSACSAEPRTASSSSVSSSWVKTCTASDSSTSFAPPRPVLTSATDRDAAQMRTRAAGCCSPATIVTEIVLPTVSMRLQWAERSTRSSRTAAKSLGGVGSSKRSESRLSSGHISVIAPATRCCCLLAASLCCRPAAVLRTMELSSLVPSSTIRSAPSSSMRFSMRSPLPPRSARAFITATRSACPAGSRAAVPSLSSAC
mmetsp:Transcript_9964/g.34735  ORF Transcript_9964/g.34735 Transcript_9964/m.34735 type:complete len:218 (+) Transcript_9964:641-1294(+)